MRSSCTFAITAGTSNTAIGTIVAPRRIDANHPAL